MNEYQNLDIIYNARIDSVLYDLPPEDFELETPKAGDWKIGVRPVLTKLWGERIVYAFVTLPKSGNGSHRLFFCTKKPENILLDYSKYEDNAMREYGEEKKQYLPLSCYLLHWRIETSYYESKTFWSFEEYRVWSCKGIERLINLECIAYYDTQI